MAQFKAQSESVRYCRSGEAWEITGTVEEVIGQATLEAKDSEAHLVPMASEILANQMNQMEVGDTRAYNWACSVMNVKVERIA